MNALIVILSGLAFASAGALFLHAANSAKRARAWRGEALRSRAALSTLEARLAERERALQELRAGMETEFKASAADLLDAAHRSFLQRANETFARHQESSAAETERRETALNALIAPMAETLTKYEKGLANLHAEQARARGELVGRIEELAKSASDMKAEARKLSTALRAGPKTRGRWGEEQLRNVVETAGMAAHVDFVEQASLGDGAARKTPDMVVNLPGDRVIAVDAKVSLAAYLDAMETDDPVARDALISQHADDIWAHVKALSARDYAAALKDSLDVVVMFVPGENYFAAAMEARPQLFQDAFDRKILVATPTTLVAILKAAAFNWRQESAVAHAQDVARLAKDLYASLRTMTGRMDDLGRTIGRAADAYNAAAAGFEARVLPRARKLAVYEMPGTDDPIPALREIEASLRSPSSQERSIDPPSDDRPLGDAAEDAGASRNG
ncbi:MAG: DNA recombination protein RmuC [Pseudomonadota bacterium]